MGKKRDCRPCDLLWGAVGIGAGMLLLYIGIDLLTNGAITAMITGGAVVDEAIEEGVTGDDE